MSDDIDRYCNLIHEQQMAAYRKRRALLDPLSITYKPSPLVEIPVPRRRIRRLLMLVRCIWPLITAGVLAIGALVWLCGCDVDLHGAFLGSRGSSDAAYHSPPPEGAVKIYYYQRGQSDPDYGMFLANRLNFRSLLAQFAEFEVTESCIGSYPVGCCYGDGSHADENYAACKDLINHER